MTTNDKIIARWKGRQAEQRYRGKAKDAAALNFLCGAAAALEAVYPPTEDQQHPDISAALMLAFMVSARGAGELDRCGKTPQPAVQSAA